MIKNYRKTDVDVELVTLEDIAIANLRESKDILPVRFKLCHEGANSKGDRFNQQELKAAWKTPMFKPLNWEHDEPNIGTIVASSLQQEVDDKRYFIQCDGNVWRFKYPEYTNLVQAGYKNNDLCMSMECWFTDFNVVIGEYDYVVPEAEASEELLGAIGTTVDNKFVSRELINVIFGGGAFTYSPADDDATILACASNRTDKEYHDYLHKVYEKQIPSPMTEEQIILEHARLHSEGKFLIVEKDFH